jgi:signal transduction histidine kinase
MALWLAIASLGALAIVVAVRLRRKLRTAASVRDERVRREQEAEASLRLTAARLQVADEVHDTVAHRLVDVNTLAAVAAHFGSDEGDQALQDIKRICAEGLADLRATVSVIRQRDDQIQTP